MTKEELFGMLGGASVGAVGGAMKGVSESDEHETKREKLKNVLWNILGGVAIGAPGGYGAGKVVHHLPKAIEAYKAASDNQAYVQGFMDKLAQQYNYVQYDPNVHTNWYDQPVQRGFDYWPADRTASTNYPGAGTNRINEIVYRTPAQKFDHYLKGVRNLEPTETERINRLRERWLSNPRPQDSIANSPLREYTGMSTNPAIQQAVKDMLTGSGGRTRREWQQGMQIRSDQIDAGDKTPPPPMTGPALRNIRRALEKVQPPIRGTSSDNVPDYDSTPVLPDDPYSNARDIINKPAPHKLLNAEPAGVKQGAYVQGFMDKCAQNSDAFRRSNT